MKFILFLIFISKVISNDDIPDVKNKENNNNLISSFNQSVNPYDYFEVAGLNDEISDISNNYLNPDKSILIDKNTKLFNEKSANVKKLEKEIEEIKLKIKNIEKKITDVKKGSRSADSIEYYVKSYKEDIKKIEINLQSKQVILDSTELSIINKDNNSFSNIKNKLHQIKSILNSVTITDSIELSIKNSILEMINKTINNENKNFKEDEKIFITSLDNSKILLNIRVNNGSIKDIEKATSLCEKVNIKSKYIILKLSFSRDNLLESKSTISNNKSLVNTNLSAMSHVYMSWSDCPTRNLFQWISFRKKWIYLEYRQDFIIVEINNNNIQFNYKQGDLFYEDEYNKAKIKLGDYYRTFNRSINQPGDFLEFSMSEYDINPSYKKEFNTHLLGAKLNCFIKSKYNLNFSFYLSNLIQPNHIEPKVPVKPSGSRYFFENNNPEHVTNYNDFYKILQQTLDKFKIIKVPNVLLSILKDRGSIYNNCRADINQKMLFTSPHVPFSINTGENFLYEAFNLSNYITTNSYYLNDILIPSIIIEKALCSERDILDISFLKDLGLKEKKINIDNREYTLKFNIDDISFASYDNPQVVLKISLWLLSDKQLKNLAINDNLETVKSIDKSSSEIIQSKLSLLKIEINKIIESIILNTLDSGCKIFQGFYNNPNGISLKLNTFLENNSCDLNIKVNENSEIFKTLQILNKKSLDGKTINLENGETVSEEGYSNFKGLIKNALNISSGIDTFLSFSGDSISNYIVDLPINVYEFAKLDNLENNNQIVSKISTEMKNNFNIYNKENRKLEMKSFTLIRVNKLNPYNFTYDLKVVIESNSLPISIKLNVKPLVYTFPILKDSYAYGSDKPNIEIEKDKAIPFYVFYMKEDIELKNDGKDGNNVFNIDSKSKIQNSEKILDLDSKINKLNEKDKTRLEPYLTLHNDIDNKAILYNKVVRHTIEDGTIIYMLYPCRKINNESFIVDIFNFGRNENIIMRENKGITKHNISEDKLTFRIDVNYSNDFKKYFSKVKDINLRSFKGVFKSTEKTEEIKNLSIEKVSNARTSLEEFKIKQMKYNKDESMSLFIEVDGLRKIYNDYLQEKSDENKIFVNYIIDIETNEGNLIAQEEKSIEICFGDHVESNYNYENVCKDYQNDLLKNYKIENKKEDFIHININATTFMRKGDVSNTYLNKKKVHESLTNGYYSYSEYEAVSNCGEALEIPENVIYEENSILISFLGIEDIEDVIENIEGLDKSINRDKVYIYVETSQGNMFICENEIRNLVLSKRDKGILKIPLSKFKNINLDEAIIKIIITPNIRLRGAFQNIKKTRGKIDFDKEKKLERFNCEFENYKLSNELQDVYAKLSKPKVFEFKLKKGKKLMLAASGEVAYSNIETTPSKIEYSIEEHNNFKVGKTTFDMKLSGYKKEDNFKGIDGYFIIGLEPNKINNLEEIRKSVEKELNNRLHYEKGFLERIDTDKDNGIANFKLDKLTSYNGTMKLLEAFVFRNGFKVKVDTKDISFINNSLKAIFIKKAIFSNLSKKIELTIDTKHIPLKVMLDNEIINYNSSEDIFVDFIKTKIIFAKEMDDLNNKLLKVQNKNNSIEKKIIFQNIENNIALNSSQFFRKSINTPSRLDIFSKTYIPSITPGEGEGTYKDSGKSFTWNHLLCEAIINIDNKKNFITKGTQAKVEVDIDEIEVQFKGDLNELADKFNTDRGEANGHEIDFTIDSDNIFTEIKHKPNLCKIESKNDYFEFNIVNDKAILVKKDFKSNLLIEPNGKDIFEDGEGNKKVIPNVINSGRGTDRTISNSIIHFKESDVKGRYKPKITGKVFKISKIKGKDSTTDEIIGNISKDQITFYKGALDIEINIDKKVYPMDGKFLEKYYQFKQIKNQTFEEFIDNLNEKDYIFYLKMILLSHSQSILVEIFKSGMEKCQQSIVDLGNELKQQRESFIEDRLVKIENKIRAIERSRWKWKTFFSIIKTCLGVATSFVSGPGGIIVSNLLSNYASTIEFLCTGNASFNVSVLGSNMSLNVDKSAKNYISSMSLGHNNMSLGLDSNGLSISKSVKEFENIKLKASTEGDIGINYKLPGSFQNVALGARVNPITGIAKGTMEYNYSNGTLSLKPELGFTLDVYKGALDFNASATASYVRESNGSKSQANASISIDKGIINSKTNNFNASASASHQTSPGLLGSHNLDAQFSTGYDKDIIFTSAGIMYNGVSLINPRYERYTNEEKGRFSDVFSPGTLENIVKLGGEKLATYIETVNRKNALKLLEDEFNRKVLINFEDIQNYSKDAKDKLLNDFLVKSDQLSNLSKNFYINGKTIEPDKNYIQNTLNEMINNPRGVFYKTIDQLYAKEKKEVERIVEEKIKDKVLKETINGTAMIAYKDEEELEKLRKAFKDVVKITPTINLKLKNNVDLNLQVIDPTSWSQAFLKETTFVKFKSNDTNLKELKNIESVDYYLPNKTGKLNQMIKIDQSMLSKINSINDLKFYHSKDSKGNDIAIVTIEKNKVEILNINEESKNQIKQLKDKKVKTEGDKVRLKQLENSILNSNILINRADVIVKSGENQANVNNFLSSVSIDSKNRDYFKMDVTAAIAGDIFKKLHNIDSSKMKKLDFNEAMKEIENEIKNKLEMIKEDLVKRIKDSTEQYRKESEIIIDRRFKQNIDIIETKLANDLDSELNNLMFCCKNAINSKKELSEILKDFKRSAIENSSFFKKDSKGNIISKGIALTFQQELESDKTNLANLSLDNINEKDRVKIREFINSNNLTGKQYVKFFEELRDNDQLSIEQKKKIIYDTFIKFKNKSQNIPGLLDPAFYIWAEKNQEFLFSPVQSKNVKYNILNNNFISRYRNAVKEHSREVKANNINFEESFSKFTEGKGIKYGTYELTNENLEAIAKNLNKIGIVEENSLFKVKGFKSNVAEEMNEELKLAKNNSEAFNIIKEYIKKNQIVSTLNIDINEMHPNVACFPILSKLKDDLMGSKSKPYSSDNGIFESNHHGGAQIKKEIKVIQNYISSEGKLNKISDNKEIEYQIERNKFDKTKSQYLEATSQVKNYILKVQEEKVIYSYNNGKISKKDFIYKDEQEFIPKSNLNIESLVDSVTWRFKAGIRVDKSRYNKESK